MKMRRLSGAGVVWFMMVVVGVSGCSKQVPVSSNEQVATPAGTQPQTVDAEAERRRLEQLNAIEEKERAVREESMRRGGPGGQLPTTAAAMTREEFLQQDVYFAYDSFTLSQDAKTTLEHKASWLVMNPNVAVRIEGHCDERGTIAYNLALGERRANTVKQYLVALGVDTLRISTISYGKEFPIDPGHNEAAWARNRRAHFTIANP